MQKIRKVFGLFLLVSFLINSSVVQALPLDTGKKTVSAANDLLIDSKKSDLSSYWKREMANKKYSGTVSDKYTFNGLPSYRIELRDTDAIVNGSKRSEIATAKPDKALAERTYTFSVYLPDDEEDYTLDPKGSEIIAQWHNTPDPGEDWTYPPLALHTGAYYTDDAGHYILESNWDPAAMSTDEQIDQNGTRARYDLGSYIEDKGKWVTWTFHIKWGWLASQDPKLEIYKDGVKILDLNGLPNTTNDKVGVHMKLGIYKWDWAQPGERNKSILSNRVIYYSNVNIQ